MSGGLIAGVLTAHPPRMGVEDNAPDFQRALIAGEKELGNELLAMTPELFVVCSTHWISTFNWVVTVQRRHKGVCVADEAPELMPGSPYDWPGDPEFGAALVAAIKAADIPAVANETEHFSWDYGSYVPLHYIDPGMTVPTVLIPTVAMSSLDECVRVGRIVHDTAKATGRRAAFIASTALSHKLVRQPSAWPAQDRMDLDERFLAMLRKGEIDALLEWLPQWSEDVVAEVDGRVAATLLGALKGMVDDGVALAGSQYGPYTQSSGSGNVNVAIRPAA